MSSEWESLSQTLRESDWGHVFDHSDDHPVTQLVNNQISAKPYVYILLQALNGKLQNREREMVVRALSEKGIAEALPQLIALFLDKNEKDESLLWAVGNAVYQISKKDHLNEWIQICRDRSYGPTRQMIVLHLSKFKNCDEVFDTLISLLDDDAIRGHAIEALWRYGNPNALPFIESIDTKKGLYESKAKKTAIRRLSKKQKIKR